MSFGWSVGDLVAAVQLLVEVADAIKEIDGADTKYQQDSSYLRYLANVLEKLKDSTARCVGSATVEELRKSVQQFQKRLVDKFETDIGKESRNDWWTKLKRNPQKIRYGLAIQKDVDELRRRIDLPLKSIIIDLEIETHQNIEEITKRVREINDSRHEFSKVTDWLRPLPLDDVYERLLSTLSPRSCEWILQKKQFISWMDNDDSRGRHLLLWITGPAGHGKTRIATRVIQTLLPSKRIAYFYCDAQDGNKRSITDILRNWSWQLLRQDKSSLGEITEIITKEQLDSEKVLESILHASLQSSNDTFLVLDAFDECETKEQAKLYGILSRISKLARILVFSRPTQDTLENLNKEVAKPVLEILEISATDTFADIKQFINHEVSQLNIYDEDVYTEITLRLEEKARGMFLWVALMIEELHRPQFDDSDYLETLNHLPDDLDDLYGRILMNLPSRPRERDRSKLLLQLVLFAGRPLSLQEIGAAMKVTIGQRKLKILDLSSDERLRKVVMYNCGSLINIQNTADGKSIVTLVHYSLKEYLLSKINQTNDPRAFNFEPEEAHGIFGRICLTYLCYDNIEPLPFELGSTLVSDSSRVSLEEMRSRFSHYSQLYPLLGYSACYWWSHIRKSSLSPATHDALCALCTSASKTIRWLQILHQYHGFVEPGLTFENMQKFAHTHQALSRSAEMFFSWLNLFKPRNSRIPFNMLQTYLIDLPQNRFLPRLHVAATFNMTGAIEEYLQAGVDANQPSWNGTKAISLAARRESIEALKILIAYGADVNDDSSGRHPPPLFAALTWNPWQPLMPVAYTSAQALINAGANPCHKNWGLLVVLCSQAFENDPACVSLATAMLTHGAHTTINQVYGPTDSQRHTALDWAVKSRNGALTQLLLNHGADVNKSSLNDGTETALIHACAVTTPNAVGMCRLLLDAGAAITAQRRDGRTALHLAVSHPVPLSRYLLDAGALINAQSHDGCTPLHDAAVEDNRDMIRLLLSRSASFDVRNGFGKTPFTVAIEYGNLEAAKILQDADGKVFSETFTLPGALVLHYPSEPRDIFEAFSILQHCGNGKIPRRIILEILNFAEYWLLSRVTRKGEVRLIERDSAKRLPYLTSKPIPKTSPSVQRVTFVVWSHDQGWSSYKVSHGTFENSWTWFEADIEKSPRASNIVSHGPEKRLLTNVHASRQYRRREVSYTCLGSLKHRKWLEGLYPGDKISIIPMAWFPGWTNYVREASIEVHTTCLLPKLRASD